MSMIQLKQAVNGEYASKLSDLSPELCDLAFAAANLLVKYDMSTEGLLDVALDDESTAQEILDAIVNDLEELQWKNMVNIPFIVHPFFGSQGQ